MASLGGHCLVSNHVQKTGLPIHRWYTDAQSARQKQLQKANFPAAEVIPEKYKDLVFVLVFFCGITLPLISLPFEVVLCLALSASVYHLCIDKPVF